MTLMELLANAVHDKDLKASMVADFEACCAAHEVILTQPEKDLFSGVTAEEWDHVEAFVEGGIRSSPCAF